MGMIFDGIYFEHVQDSKIPSDETLEINLKPRKFIAIFEDGIGTYTTRHVCGDGSVTLNINLGMPTEKEREIYLLKHKIIIRK